MYEAIKWAHIISAFAMFFYLVFPFVSGSAARPESASRLHGLNRIGQYLLIVGFLTGGYMVSKAGMSGAWMAAAIVLILVMFAMAGMMGGPLKRLKAGNSGTAESLKKLRTFSFIAAGAYVLLFVLMYNPTII
ncbi:MAG: hypothetical protein K0R67_1178 [Paenibacillus sp.]|jgi:uncharacterized membrane protein|nr:hypothetical protein [Paenibacillus sp.]